MGKFNSWITWAQAAELVWKYWPHALAWVLTAWAGFNFAPEEYQWSALCLVLAAGALAVVLFAERRESAGSTRGGAIEVLHVPDIRPWTVRGNSDEEVAFSILTELIGNGEAIYGRISGNVHAANRGSHERAIDEWRSTFTVLDQPPFKSGTSSYALSTRGDRISGPLNRLREMLQNIQQWLR